MSFALLACVLPGQQAPKDAVLREFLDEYSAYAHAIYSESLAGAIGLQKSLEAFLAAPSEETLAAARKSWLAAREPYGMTEVLRFYEGPIDNRKNGPETYINAWPIDEAYIDKVKGQPRSGIVNDAKQFPVLSAEILAVANQRGGEAHVCLGWHAIEFMLWGQDLHADGPGRRDVADFAKSRGGAVARRREYLAIVAQRLVDDLEGVRDAWAPGADNFRRRFLMQDPRLSLRMVLKGMLVLSGFEMAGERMAVALENADQEDEHSCFSDNTHRDFVANQKGLLAVWNGDGPGMNKQGLRRYAALAEEKLAETIGKALDHSLTRISAMPVPFDQAILGNDEAPGRKAVLASVEALEAQADALAAFALKCGYEIAMRPGQ